MRRREQYALDKQPLPCCHTENKPRKEVRLVLLYRFGYFFTTYSHMIVELIAFALSALT